MDAKTCPSGYKFKNKTCVPNAKYRAEINEDLDQILKKGRINKNLRVAVLETKKAIANDNMKLATELTSVKSFVVGSLTDKELRIKPRSIQKYRFREDDDYNTKVIGASVYGILDGLHHDLAYSQGQLPRGMTLFTATAPGEISAYHRGEPKEKHPVVQMLKKEHDEVVRAVEAEDKKRRK